MPYNKTSSSHSEIFKKMKSEYENKFMVNDIDFSKWTPKYKVVNQEKFANGNIVYHMRSDSEKTLFMNAFYWSVYNYMLNIGFDPENPFLYVDLNPRRKHSTKYSVYRERIFDRLKMYEKVIQYGEHTRKFLFVVARFFDNDRLNNLGFYVRCCSRTVKLVIHPYTKLTTLNGSEIAPNEFFHLLLLNMHYPMYVYEYNKRNGTLNRMVREYPHLVNQTHRYKKWRF